MVKSLGRVSHDQTKKIGTNIRNYFVNYLVNLYLLENSSETDVKKCGVKSLREESKVVLM